MEPQQKKRLFWGAAIVLSALYWAPSPAMIMSLVHQGEHLKGEQLRPPPITDTGKANSNAAGVNGLSASELQIATLFDRQSGTWEGMEMVPGRGNCTHRFELRPIPGMEGHYAGFSTLICTPTMAEIVAEKNPTPQEAAAWLQKGLSPVSTILSGKVEGTALQLQTQENLNVKQVRNACVMRSMRVLGFGVNQIATAWEDVPDGPCQGGQIVLRRAGR